MQKYSSDVNFVVMIVEGGEKKLGDPTDGSSERREEQPAERVGRPPRRDSLPRPRHHPRRRGGPTGVGRIQGGGDGHGGVGVS